MPYAYGQWSHDNGFSYPIGQSLSDKAQLVIYTGSEPLVENSNFLEILRTQYPNAHLIGCCSERNGGAIEAEIQLHIFSLEQTWLRLIAVRAVPGHGAHHAGQRLGAFLKDDNLTGMVVLAATSSSQDKALLKGIADQLPIQLPIISKMLDSSCSRKHLGCNFHPQEKQVIAIGFYGPDFHNFQDNFNVEEIFNDL